ncbi:TPA: acetyltransferase [Vibrio cholerae]|nr:acetyltransferase [Vibrio cholerae]
MVTVVVIEFSGMRCQPLRRALCVKEDYGHHFVYGRKPFGRSGIRSLLFR